MCVLYKKATKQFVQYDKSTTRSELVTDVSLASDLTPGRGQETTP